MPTAPKLAISRSGLDAGPQIGERDAVVEGGAVADLAGDEPHDPGVSVRVGLAVMSKAAASHTTVTVSPSAWIERTLIGRTPHRREPGTNRGTSWPPELPACGIRGASGGDQGAFVLDPGVD
jgi:hypothetical protein